MDHDDLLSLAHQDMTAYAALMHHSWQSSWHHHILSKVLERVVAKDPAYRKLIISLPPRHGKALALDTPIPTPSGWTTMGALRPGDEVLSDTNAPCKVVAVSRVWRDRHCWRVKVGTLPPIVADAEHDWRVQFIEKRRTVTAIMPTKALRAVPGAPQPHIWMPDETMLPVVVSPLAEPVATVCIQVDSPSRLFLCGEGRIPTHNSELISKLFPGWYLGRHPHESVIVASYGAELSQEIGRHSRDYVNNPIYQRVFNTTVRTDSNAVTRWELTNGGTFHVTSVGGALTGLGTNVLCIDDALKNSDDASSPATKEKIWQWFLSTAYTRLEKEGAVIVVATRWATDDLSGRLLALPGSDWKEIKFPAVATHDERFRAEGEALWPEKMPLKELDAIKRISGRKVWSALWQQSPTVDGGAVFREDWLRYYDPERIARDPPLWKQIVQTWDTGVSAKSSSARSACITIGVAFDHTLKQDTYYILDVWADQVAFPELITRARALSERYDADEVWVEEQQTGRPLVDTLKLEMGGKIRGVRLKGDKITRASSASVLFETGRVFLPADAPTSPPWTQALIEEMLAFPSGEFVDRVDALSQGLIMLQKTGFRRTRAAPLDPFDVRSPMPVSIYGR